MRDAAGELGVEHAALFRSIIGHRDTLFPGFIPSLTEPFVAAKAQHVDALLSAEFCDRKAAPARGAGVVEEILRGSVRVAAFRNVETHKHSCSYNRGGGRFSLPH
jgi:hypothetical protein